MDGTERQMWSERRGRFREAVPAGPQICGVGRVDRVAGQA